MSGSLPAARLFDLTKHSEGLKGILPVKCDTGQQQSIWLYMALHHSTSYTYFPEIRFLQVPVRPVCLCRTPVAMPSFMAVCMVGSTNVFSQHAYLTLHKCIQT